MQVSEHVDEHAADGALPAQLNGGVQAEVDATCRHEFESVAQVATVCPSWHSVPGWVQIEAGQLHDASPLETAHVWVPEHVVVITHAVHPLGCSLQVWTAPAMHCVASAVHGLMHVTPPPSVVSTGRPVPGASGAPRSPGASGDAVLASLAASLPPPGVLPTFVPFGVSAGAASRDTLGLKSLQAGSVSPASAKATTNLTHRRPIHISFSSVRSRAITLRTYP